MKNFSTNIVRNNIINIQNYLYNVSTLINKSIKNIYNNFYTETHNQLPLFKESCQIEKYCNNKVASLIIKQDDTMEEKSILIWIINIAKKSLNTIFSTLLEVGYIVSSPLTAVLYTYNEYRNNQYQTFGYIKLNNNELDNDDYGDKNKFLSHLSFSESYYAL